MKKIFVEIGNPLSANPTKWSNKLKSSARADELFECVWPICGLALKVLTEDYYFRKKVYWCLKRSWIRLYSLSNWQTSTEFRMLVYDLGELLLTLLDSWRFYTNCITGLAGQNISTVQDLQITFQWLEIVLQKDTWQEAVLQEVVDIVDEMQLLFSSASNKSSGNFYQEIEKNVKANGFPVEWFFMLSIWTWLFEI